MARRNTNDTGRISFAEASHARPMGLKEENRTVITNNKLRMVACRTLEENVFSIYTYAVRERASLKPFQS
jgi:hypothetical protein